MPTRVWITACRRPADSDHQAPSTSVPGWCPSCAASVIWGALLHGGGGAATAVDAERATTAASAQAPAAKAPVRNIGATSSGQLFEIRGAHRRTACGRADALSGELRLQAAQAAGGPRRDHGARSMP